MNRLRRTLLWFFMICKSLLKKYSYLLILVLVPALIFAMNLVSKQESGVLTVMLVNEDPQDEIADELMNKLMSQNSVIRFMIGESQEEALEAVLDKQADAAWIFEKGMSEKLHEYTKNGKTKRGFVKVVELEDTIVLQLSREKLYGALFPMISYSSYENFIESSFVETHMIEEDKTAWKEAYEQSNREDDIFVFTFPGNTEDTIDFDEVNYLITPLRGMLMMVIVLSSFAAQMYFMRDRSKGLFVWLPQSAKFLSPYGYQYAAMLPVCTVVYLALYLSGLFTKAGIEIVSMLLFTLMMASFGNILRKICRSIRTLGAVIPVMIIIMVSLSQIFFEVNFFRPIQILLPTYYYLTVVHNSSFIWKMLVYCLTAILLDGVTYLLFEKNSKI